MKEEEKRAETSTTKTGRFRRQTPPGAPPGTLAVDPESRQTRIHLIGYGRDAFLETDVEDEDRIRESLAKLPVTWVNVEGLRDVARIKRIGEIFGLHALELEDVLNVHQRVKAEQYEQHLFLVAHMVESDPDAPLDIDQLSLFLGKNFVLTFQERPGDRLDPVREHIRTPAGRIRERGPDHLAYAILDIILDRYFPILEAYGERLDDVEEEVVAEPGRRTVAGIHEIKRDLLQLRRAIWPLRETISTLLRDSGGLVGPETHVYLRDCYDHAAQLIDLMEIYREVTSGLLDEYLSSLSNKLNETMKVLTIIATIFIPLSFIASLYGMNFNTSRSQYNMPELNWSLGYPFALGMMTAVAATLLIYFWRKGWLGSSESERTGEMKSRRKEEPERKG